MVVDVLVEPIAGDRFRATTVSPFALSAEGATDEEAISRVRRQLEEKIRNGAKVVQVMIAEPDSTPPWPDDEFTANWIEELRKIREASRTAPDPWDSVEQGTP